MQGTPAILFGSEVILVNAIPLIVPSGPSGVPLRFDQVSTILLAAFVARCVWSSPSKVGAVDLSTQHGGLLTQHDDLEIAKALRRSVSR